MKDIPALPIKEEIADVQARVVEHTVSILVPPTIMGSASDVQEQMMEVVTEATHGTMSQRVEHQTLDFPVPQSVEDIAEVIQLSAD